jgi:hypothetical protein
MFHAPPPQCETEHPNGTLTLSGQSREISQPVESSHHGGCLPLLGSRTRHRKGRSPFSNVAILGSSPTLPSSPLFRVAIALSLSRWPPPLLAVVEPAIPWRLALCWETHHHGLEGRGCRRTLVGIPVPARRQSSRSKVHYAPRGLGAGFQNRTLQHDTLEARSKGEWAIICTSATLSSDTVLGGAKVKTRLYPDYTNSMRSTTIGPAPNADERIHTAMQLPASHQPIGMRGQRGGSKRLGRMLCFLATSQNNFRNTNTRRQPSQPKKKFFFSWLNNIFRSIANKANGVRSPIINSLD